MTVIRVYNFTLKPLKNISDTDTLQHCSAGYTQFNTPRERLASVTSACTQSTASSCVLVRAQQLVLTV
jgi:hypothetical protein